MSVRVMTAVWGLDLPDSEKIVLLALADCANDEGHCWPGMRSLVTKCSKTDRTIQACIKSLCDKGHMTRSEIPGKGCNYRIHPRDDDSATTAAIDQVDTPEAASPRSRFPPKGTTHTPEAASGKPSRTINKPKADAFGRARSTGIPSNWWPQDFGAGTQTRKIIDGWPPGELEVQVEQFIASHTAKGNRFANLQSAFSTWVLNSRKFGVRRNDRQGQPSRNSAAFEFAMRGLEPGATF